MRRPGSRSDAERFATTPEDPEAFGEFYGRHEQAVLRFFVYWCRSGEVAADLTAETFAAVFESLPRYEPERGEPRAWLFGIAQNILARSVKRGRVEDQTRRRLGLGPVVVDDDALERIEALASRCLRTGRALRKPGPRAQARNRVPDMINIAPRSQEADDRAVPGHWEGDLLIGNAQRTRDVMGGRRREVTEARSAAVRAAPAAGSRGRLARNRRAGG